MLKKCNYQGVDIHYTVAGTGEAVVLIHGFAEDARIWDNFLDEVPGYSIIIPDLPGSGASAGLNDLRIESMADVMIAILDQERISIAVVVGHSMGGYVTLAMAEKFPKRIRAFGLFHSTAFADSEDKKASRLKNIKFIETYGSHEFLKQSTPPLFSDSFKKNQPEVVESLIERYKAFQPAVLINYLEAMMMRPDRTAVLLNTSKPVLFIIGTEDNAIPFADSLKLCHLPSLSYIHILGNMGHMGMVEVPDRCKKILENFLLDVTAQPISAVKT